ncbi:MAG: N-acetyltransferase [Sulfurospirillaceae bacterium]|nr:N-acetyltransferase [Sulfurospirillaceae bacterium]
MITISRALAQDVPRLCELENQVFISSDGIITKRAFLYHVKKDNLLLVCKKNKKIIGYILFFCPANKAYSRLYSLAVLPQFQGKGYASTLIKKALAKIDERYKRIFLEVRISNKGAIKLYESFGFVKTKVLPKYYSDGEDALKMCRDI